MSPDTTALPAPASAEAPMILIGPDGAGGAGDELIERARAAWREAVARLGVSAHGPIRIIACRNALDMERRLDSRPEHVLAVARADRREILINVAAWRATPVHQQQQTLVHEMVHLILGVRVPARLPAWLEEGIAMHAAGQQPHRAYWRVLGTGTFGGLLSLARLQHTLLLGGELQALAYAEAWSVTGFLLRRDYMGPDGRPCLTMLIAELTDREFGRSVVRRMWSPAWRDSLDLQWRRRHGSLWRWLAFFTASGVMWVFITGLFLLAWWRKRRMARMTRERFASDEAMAAEFGVPPWERPDSDAIEDVIDGDGSDPTDDSRPA